MCTAQVSRMPMLLVVLSLLSIPALGQRSEANISELKWSDRHDLEEKVRIVDDLGRRNFGIPVRNDKTDLELLQRIADEKIIDPEDAEKLQALGAVLGNVLQQQLNLVWRVYEDDLGRSRALCVPDSKDCVFPITLLSHRLKVGLNVDVEEIYNNAVAAIEPYIPDNNGYDGIRKPPAPDWQPPSGPIKKIRVR